MDNEQMKTNSAADAVPTFTPPTPTFEPPKDAKPQFNGPACYYHKDEPAVAKCARCGKYICKDCFDNYGVSGGQYAGQALCYDCCQALVQENVQELTANKEKIKLQFILSIVGIVIGFIFGIVGGSSDGFGSAMLSGIVCAGIGGVFLSFIKAYLLTMWDGVKAMFSAIFDGSGIAGIIGAILGMVIRVFIEAIKCVFATIRNTIDYIIYLKKTQGFIESDSAALQQMKDYMEYTMIRNQNRGVDLNTLLNQKSELADNSYARMVREKGEDGAEAALRDCVATINENGEIIRSFNRAA